MLTPGDAEDLERILGSQEHFEVERLNDISELDGWLIRRSSMIVFCDEANSWEALLRKCKTIKHCRVVVCTRKPYAQLQALWKTLSEAGCYDLLTLPFDQTNLQRVAKLVSLEFTRKQPQL